MASTSLQGLDLPKKLCRECCFAPEALITGVASQARVHVTHSHFEGAPEDTQSLVGQFKHHVRLAPRSRWRSAYLLEQNGGSPPAQADGDHDGCPVQNTSEKSMC